MVKEMDHTMDFNTGFENEREIPADFGRNEIVVYRGSKVGRVIVALMSGIVIMNIVLCLISVGMFTKSIRMSDAAIKKSEELIEILSISDQEAADSKATDSKEDTLIASEEKETTVADEVTSDDNMPNEEPVIKSDAPVSLSTMKMVSEEGVDLVDQCQNTLGNTYSSAILGIYDKKTWVTYYLAGQYSSLTADLSVYESPWVTESPYTFEIYTNNDENSVIYTTSLSRLSTVEHLDIDVSGAEFITIRARYNSYDQRPSFILSDAKLTKNEVN